jgi:uncharacterized protein (TIGR03435 family)
MVLCEFLILLLLGLMGISLPAPGQENASVSHDVNSKPLAYEVVSVRASQPCGGMSFAPSPGRFSAKCITLWGLIYNAYAVRPNDPIKGLPGWAESAPFDVEAKMDEDTVAALGKLSPEQQDEQHKLMLRALLGDRFKLRIHHETVERPIYELTPAKGGFKLKEAPATDAGGGMSWRPGRIDIKKGSIGGLAFTLSDLVGRMVVDKTGITGKYDIALQWIPDELQGTPDAGPSIFTAIEEQLGLKLEATKGPVDIVVADHAEKPSEN